MYDTQANFVDVSSNEPLLYESDLAPQFSPQRYQSVDFSNGTIPAPDPTAFQHACRSMFSVPQDVPSMFTLQQQFGRDTINDDQYVLHNNHPASQPSNSPQLYWPLLERDHREIGDEQADHSGFGETSTQRPPAATSFRRLVPRARIPRRDGRKLSKKSDFQALKKVARVRKCTCPKEIVPPRPPNAFICFRMHERSRVKDQGFTDEAEISSKCAETWRKMSPEQKKPYKDKSSELTRQQLNNFPGYKYRPGRKADDDFGYPNCKCNAYQDNMTSLRARDLQAAQEIETAERGKVGATERTYPYTNADAGKAKLAGKRKRESDSQQAHSMNLRRRRRVEYVEPKEDFDFEPAFVSGNYKGVYYDDGDDILVSGPTRGRKAAQNMQLPEMVQNGDQLESGPSQVCCPTHVYPVNVSETMPTLTSTRSREQYFATTGDLPSSHMQQQNPSVFEGWPLDPALKAENLLA